MKHHIVISFEKKTLNTIRLSHDLRKYICAALDAEKITAPCEINVLVAGDETIRAINAQSRQIDRATDVLSFPMFELTPGCPPESWEEYIDPETNLVPLGDMAISLERAKEQAKEFGHSVNREIGYLTVHSVLHLLGYDHMDDGEMKKQMRAREEAIMAGLELYRA